MTFIETKEVARKQKGSDIIQVSNIAIYSHHASSVFPDIYITGLHCYAAL